MAQNKKQNKVTLSTTLWATSLTQLQLISQISGRQGRVEMLIQHAVDEYIERVTESPEFADKLLALRGQHQSRQEEVGSALNMLIDMATKSNRVAGEEGEPATPQTKEKGTVTLFPKPPAS